MQRRRTFVGIWLVLLVTCFLGNASASRKPTCYLLDLSAKSMAVPWDKPPRASHVHIVMGDHLNDWVYVLSDAAGRIRKPLKRLVAGSVLEGGQVGGSATQNYELLPSGQWKITTKPRKITFLDPKSVLPLEMMLDALPSGSAKKARAF